MQKKILIYSYSIKVSKKTLKFVNIEVNKKEFHASKQAIDLNLVDINKIVISDKFKHRDNDKDDHYVRPLCIIVPQISGYIKYFENV